VKGNDTDFEPRMLGSKTGTTTACVDRLVDRGQTDFVHLSMLRGSGASVCKE
jgi:hypothetical protein